MTGTTADVVVIGAGVLGAAAAYQLARRGLRVVVAERRAPNREGSGTTAGNLHVQGIHTRRPGQAVPVDSERFLPLQKAASDRWESVEAELGVSVELQRSGGLTIAETEDQVAELKVKAGWEAAAGIETELIDGGAARQLMPQLGPTVLAATWCPADGYANPMLVTHAYLTAARRLGAQLRPFTPVTGLTPRDGGWRVSTPGGHLDAPVVVNVAGPWTGQITALAGAGLRVTPVAIQMHATVRAPALLRHLVQHIGEGLSVKQVTTGTVLIGGGWPAAGLNLNGRTQVSVASMAGNLAQAIRVLPPLAELRLLRAWAGPLAATPDEMPVIGAVPGAPGMYVAAGTYAFTFAPLWGETLAALVAGERPPVEVGDLGPERLLRGDSDASTPR
jgi:sarcosine oxidase, subunit beta